MATWEAKTDEKLKQSAAQRRLEALQARREADLEARRRELAALLQQEEEALKEELVRGQLTPEQRRKQMAERALLLGRAEAVDVRPPPPAPAPRSTSCWPRPRPRPCVPGWTMP